MVKPVLSVLTYEIIFTAKEALPFYPEDVWIRSVCVFAVGVAVPPDDDVVGVEVWLVLNVPIICCPVIPSQNASTPKINVIFTSEV